MAKSNLRVQAGSLSTSASNLNGVAETARQNVASAFRGAHLGGAGANAVFAGFVDDVLDTLESNLPGDIERLIKSYAGALLALDSSTTATDGALANTARAD